jgi:hypothetical protein
VKAEVSRARPSIFLKSTCTFFYSSSAELVVLHESYTFQLGVVFKQHTKISLYHDVILSLPYPHHHYHLHLHSAPRPSRTPPGTMTTLGPRARSITSGARFANCSSHARSSADTLSGGSAKHSRLSATTNWCPITLKCRGGAVFRCERRLVGPLSKWKTT